MLTCDLEVCSNGGQFLKRPDRLCFDDVQPLVPSSTTVVASRSHGNPDPGSVAAENWERAEEVTREIFCGIHPTVEADRKRHGIIRYLQLLIKTSLGLELFTYGSVPLKTYLPDGDIDLTAFSYPTTEEVLVADVYSILKEEDRNTSARYRVKNVHRIDAEVKLIKCSVDNIVVDISFNQLGGLCTLCFLEQVDRLVGKNHLFKRSIILIKAWCYYESRILGAHHGLIATYALETLVLYLFHHFHSSLNGPLSVLYRFLDYFSTFDWENYCISLHGPVCKSSLSEFVAKPPECKARGLFFSEEFLKKCLDMYSVSSARLEASPRVFAQKHLNILDPLKENNNLGRSVNKGNFYRICSAFKHGARKLGRVLLLPKEDIANELKKLFANSLDRQARAYWSDWRSSSAYACARSQCSTSMLNLSGDYESHFRSVLYGQFCHLCSASAAEVSKPSLLPEFQRTSHQQAVCQSLQLEPHRISHITLDDFPNLEKCRVSHLATCTIVPDSKEKEICRGTGTYIPKLTYQLVSNKHNPREARNDDFNLGSNVQLQGNDPFSSVQPTLQEIAPCERHHVLSEVEYPHLNSGKSKSSEAREPNPFPPGCSNANVFSWLAAITDSGSQASNSQESTSPEGTTATNLAESTAWECASSPISPAVSVEESCEPIPDSTVQRLEEEEDVQVYQLKDEVDFPPLSQTK
ncbi:hypothetical protein LINPERHAP2_LOCUS34554 [Linum perenne]